MTEQQQQAEANLVVAYPKTVCFDVTNTDSDLDALAGTLRVYDELVELGRAEVITAEDAAQLAGSRGYRLSAEAAEAHRQVIQQRADDADQN